MFSQVPIKFIFGCENSMYNVIWCTLYVWSERFWQFGGDILVSLKALFEVIYHYTLHSILLLLWIICSVGIECILKNEKNIIKNSQLCATEADF